jgi:hypothetical protein
MELVGTAGRTWTKLAADAVEGSRELALLEALPASAGDQVVVTGSDFQFIEHGTVERVENDGKLLVLSQPLAHAHAGPTARHSGREETQGLIGTEVGLIKGSITIEGVDTPGLDEKPSLGVERYGAIVTSVPLAVPGCGSAFSSRAWATQRRTTTS